MRISKLMPFKDLDAFRSFRVPENPDRFIKCDPKWFSKDLNVYDLSNGRFYKFDNNASVADLGDIWSDREDLSKVMKKLTADQLKKETDKAIRSIPDGVHAMIRVADELKSLRELITPLVEALVKEKCPSAANADDDYFMKIPEGGLDSEIPFDNNITCSLVPSLKPIDLISDISDELLPCRIKSALVRAGFIHVDDLRYVKLRDIKKVKNLGKLGMRLLNVFLEQTIGLVLGNAEPIRYSEGQSVACGYDLARYDLKRGTILRIINVKDVSDTKSNYVLTKYTCEDKDGNCYDLTPSEIAEVF